MTAQSLTSPIPKTRTLLIGGRLIDGTGADPVDGAGVLIDGERLVAAGANDSLPRSDVDRVIDLDGRTVMPGLVDSHTHVTYHTVEPDVWRLDETESVELNTLRAANNARHILACGFTSIGDGGCRGFIAPAIRDAVRSGLISGPDVHAAGPILCGLGGLLDNDPAWRRTSSQTALATIVTGPEEVRRAVRMQVKGGVDWIKVAASGVAGSSFNSARHEDLSRAEMSAAVFEAAKFGKYVHAHAHSRGGVRAAIDAGVISLHSAEFADEELLLAMRDRQIPFSPTIAWLHARCMNIDDGSGRPPPSDTFVEEAWQAYAAARETVTAARQIGTPLALGTDAFHRFAHIPDGVLEMEYLCALGYSSLEAIRSATEIAARAINPHTDVGTLAANRRANLIVVDGNPAEDVSVLRDKSRIHYLFQAGEERPLAAGRGVVGPRMRIGGIVHGSLAETRAIDWRSPTRTETT